MIDNQTKLVKGDKILISNKNNERTKAIVTGVTHGNIVWYKIVSKDEFMCGCVGSDYVIKR